MKALLSIAAELAYAIIQAFSKEKCVIGIGSTACNLKYSSELKLDLSMNSAKSVTKGLNV
jgi:hypothetical protein